MAHVVAGTATASRAQVFGAVALVPGHGCMLLRPVPWAKPPSPPAQNIQDLAGCGGSFTCVLLERGGWRPGAARSVLPFQVRVGAGWQQSGSRSMQAKRIALQR
jgi:hypothetical protein